MPPETPPENSFEPTLTPKRAVLVGHLVISLPVVIIMGLVPLLGYILRGQNGAMIGAVLGFVVAWLWWSVFVPRWREWARSRGADEKRTQFLAERSLLVWPKGSILEKTEIRPRKKP
jgi:hypothetical protein